MKKKKKKKKAKKDKKKRKGSGSKKLSRVNSMGDEDEKDTDKNTKKQNYISKEILRNIATVEFDDLLIDADKNNEETDTEFSFPTIIRNKANGGKRLKE